MWESMSGTRFILRAMECGPGPPPPPAPEAAASVLLLSSCAHRRSSKTLSPPVFPSDMHMAMLTARQLHTTQLMQMASINVICMAAQISVSLYIYLYFLDI
eukprot:TRINITY_DN493_c1_g2_i3.p2 TRINITY_DN493_c1_g2~~TRINITY_DN493_c1_g2_i3.p2  ORF type:complete len:101 (-),score=16.97 TRINITY_DN493_c1_g2_i3:162-464(-)